MGAKKALNSVVQWLSKLPDELKYTLLMFFATRIALTLVGVIARKMMNLTTYAFKYTGLTAFDIWGVWDTEWYVRVATEGYSTKLYGQYHNYGFFPLYPLLMRYLGGLIGSEYVAGLIISNVSLILACVLLYRLFRIDYDKPTSMRSIKYLFLFPSAFIFSGIYSESLFLLLAVACFYYARKDKWALVGILGFFMALTRYIGFVFVIPLLYEYFASKNYNWRKIRWNVLYLILLPAGFIAFMVFIYYLTGDPLGYFKVQKAGWGFELGSPISWLFGAPKNAGEVIARSFIFIGTGLLIWSFRKIRFSYWIMALLSIWIPVITNALPGTLRYFLPTFPIYLILAILCQNKRFDDSLTPAFAILQGLIMAIWTIGGAIII